MRYRGHKRVKISCTSIYALMIIYLGIHVYPTLPESVTFHLDKTGFVLSIYLPETKRQSNNHGDERQEMIFHGLGLLGV
jgi:hypothetical protein